MVAQGLPKMQTIEKNLSSHQTQRHISIFIKKGYFSALSKMYVKEASYRYKCLCLQVLLRVSTLPVSRPAAAIKLMARVFGRVGQILWQCNLTHSGRLSNQLDRLEDQELEGGGA